MRRSFMGAHRRFQGVQMEAIRALTHAPCAGTAVLAPRDVAVLVPPAAGRWCPASHDQEVTHGSMWFRHILFFCR